MATWLAGNIIRGDVLRGRPVIAASDGQAREICRPPGSYVENRVAARHVAGQPNSRSCGLSSTDFRPLLWRRPVSEVWGAALQHGSACIDQPRLP